MKMANIIDSFFVQIGLDASLFTIGQREADVAWGKTKNQAVAAAKQIEENRRKLATSFDTLKRQAIEGDRREHRRRAAAFPACLSRRLRTGLMSREVEK
jgi:hypothetical protein